MDNFLSLLYLFFLFRGNSNEKQRASKMPILGKIYLHVQSHFKIPVTTTRDLIQLLEASLLAVTTYGWGKFTLYEKNDPDEPHPVMGDGDIIVDLTYNSITRPASGWMCTGGEELVDLADEYIFDELGDVRDRISRGHRRPITSPAVMFNDHRGKYAPGRTCLVWFWLIVIDGFCFR